MHTRRSDDPLIEREKERKKESFDKKKTASCPSYGE